MASSADGTRPVGKCARQPDHHLNRLQFVDELGQPSQVAVRSVAADGLHRRGEDSVRVAHRDTDANASHVDAQPASPSGIVASGPIRQTVFWVAPRG